MLAPGYASQEAAWKSAWTILIDLSGSVSTFSRLQQKTWTGAQYLHYHVVYLGIASYKASIDS